MDITLSKTEAIQFLNKVLGIQAPEEKLIEDKREFLNVLVHLYVEHIPFQNIQLLAKAYHGQNNVPEWPEIKENMLAGRGGICYTVGVFMKVLLETLGYNVYFASCAIENPFDHICTVVRNLSHEGSEHLIDVIGYPNFELFPLDFIETSPVYKNSFCTHYFKRIGEKTIQRCNIKGMDGKERIFGTFSVESYLLPRFFTSMNNIYTNADKSHFLQELMAITFLGGKCVAIRGSALLREDEQHTMQKTIVNSASTADFLQKQFPQIPTSIIADALAYLKEYEQSHPRI